MFSLLKKAVTEADTRARKVGGDVRHAGQNAYYAGVGVYATAEEETKSFFDRLVDKGKAYDEKRPDVVNETSERVRKFGQKVEDRVEQNVSSALNRVGVPSRKEIRTLINRVEKLTKKVDAMNTAN